MAEQDYSKLTDEQLRNQVLGGAASVVENDSQNEMGGSESVEETQNTSEVSHDEKAGDKTDKTEKPKTESDEKSESGTSDASEEVEKNEQETKAEETKKLSPKESASKAREAKAWKAISTAKEEAKKEREEWLKQQEALKADWQKKLDEINQVKTAIEQERLQREEERKAEEARLAPEHFERLAEMYMQQGDTRMAELAKAEARNARNRQQERIQYQQQKVAERFNSERTKWDTEAFNVLPELNDQTSPYHKQAREFIQNNSDIKQTPRALWLVATYLKEQKEKEHFKAEASKVPDLQKLVSEKDTEIASLKSKLNPAQPRSNTPLTKPVGGEASLAKASDDELRKMLGLPALAKR